MVYRTFLIGCKETHFSLSPQNLRYVIAANTTRNFSKIRAWRKGVVKKWV